MVALERKPEEGPKVKLLAPLGEMVGVQKALKGLAEQGQPLNRESILEILKSQHENYSSMRGFEKKTFNLGEIIRGFEEETFGVQDLLQAAGVQTPETNNDNSKARRGSFRRR